ncbi:MAG: STAS domain-containing protein [bacterium]
MEGIHVSVEKVGPNQNISVIKVGGYIDTTTSAELEHALSNLLKAHSYRIIIDLGNVDYISSAGWGIFISEIKGIREKAGDLKLVRMIPDVYEVFELLEFHYILKAFDTLEEAIADFDSESAGSGVALPPYESEQTGDEKSAATSQEVKTDVAQVETRYEPSSDDAYLETIEEKLRQIIIEKPDAGMFQLIRSLNTPRFGNLKLGWFEMRKYLKQLNLESKKKRVEYFKQNTFG